MVPVASLIIRVIWTLASRFVFQVYLKGVISLSSNALRSGHRTYETAVREGNETSAAALA